MCRLHFLELFLLFQQPSHSKKSQYPMIHESSHDLMNQSQHIDRVVSNFTSKQIANNRIRLKASIDVVRHLSLQAIAFRGRDESSTSTNRGNFLTTLDLMVGYNNDIVEIMAKAPKNATYTSPQIQKKKKIYMLFQSKCEEGN